jgi:hypothetical protein
LKLEVVVLPVSDADRARAYYPGLGEADPNWPDWYAQFMVDEQE